VLTLTRTRGGCEGGAKVYEAFVHVGSIFGELWKFDDWRWEGDIGLQWRCVTFRRHVSHDRAETAGSLCWVHCISGHGSAQPICNVCVLLTYCVPCAMRAVQLRLLCLLGVACEFEYLRER